MDKTIYQNWESVRTKLNEITNFPNFSEGEIWWVFAGENVGIEINGKGVNFLRPVLIFKKLSKFGFVGIPLTSQKHGGDWYVKFEFQKKVSYAAIAQIKTFSAARLRKRMGQVPNNDMNKMKIGIFKLYLMR